MYPHVFQHDHISSPITRIIKTAIQTFLYKPRQVRTESHLLVLTRFSPTIASMSIAIKRRKSAVARSSICLWTDWSRCPEAPRTRMRNKTTMLQSIKSIGRVSPDNARAIYAKSPTAPIVRQMSFPLFRRGFARTLHSSDQALYMVREQMRDALRERDKPFRTLLARHLLTGDDDREMDEHLRDQPDERSVRHHRNQVRERAVVCQYADFFETSQPTHNDMSDRAVVCARAAASLSRMASRSSMTRRDTRLGRRRGGVLKA